MRLPKLDAANLWRGLLVLAFVLMTLALVILATNLKFANNRIRPGVTFSNLYAAELGLNTREAFLAMVDDLKIRRLRLPVYWSKAESARDQLDFEEVDWMLNEAERRGLSVILTLGQKAPRYPECFIPRWVTEDERQARLLSYLKRAVQHFERFPAFEAWQIENEPSLWFFGDCPKIDLSFFKQELALVRSLSNKAIITTSSGEFGDWLGDGSLVDALGISVYRAAHFHKIGLVQYPFSPAYYNWRAQIIKDAVPRIFVSELQLEPWSDRPLGQMSPSELEILFPVSKLRNDLEFAGRLGFPEVYLWGAEWWYWMKQQGKPEWWDAVKLFVAQSG